MTNSTVPASFVPPTLPGWRHVYSGKVRDVYEPTDQAAADTLLVVASDRISAFDFVLDTLIPDKGKVLTALSLWWFEQLADIIPSHVVSTAVPDAVSGRAMVVRRLEMYPVECIARGYLTGSGLVEYRRDGAVCGIALPPGLQDGSKLPEAIFTPSTKADLGEHDENVSFEAVAGEVGGPVAAALRQATLALYTRAEQLASERGIILADTKFEFGADPSTGALTLGDEVLTPDSSRFWDAAAWEPGHAQASFDKQYVRDWLTGQSGWDRSGGTPPPALPTDIVERTRARYLEAHRLLTGRSL